MVGVSFTDTGGGCTSWGWRGDRRLWRIRLPRDPSQPVEYLSYEYGPVEAYLEFMDRMDFYGGVDG